MKAIYYNTKDRWGDYWKELERDSSDLDQNSYPFFPATNYLKNDGLILEAGCGLGRLVKWLANHNFNVVGMELEEYSITRLQKDSFDLKCVRGNVSQLPFKDESFKYIFLMGALDVFMDDRERGLALSEARRVLQGEGIAFISVPHARSLFWNLYAFRRNNLLRKMLRKSPLEQHIGQFAFTKNDIQALIGSYFYDYEIHYVNARMAFFYVFPFLRSSRLHKERFPDLQRKERACGEKVYEFNLLGKALYPIISFVFKKIISPSLYVVAKK